MTPTTPSFVSLQFPLMVEDGWPPVAVESLPFHGVGGSFQVLNPPLFIRGLSVGDILSVSMGADDQVKDWHHIHRSGRSTVWLLRLAETDEIAPALKALRNLGCNTMASDIVGAHSVDVPETVAIAQVDAILDALDRDTISVAFPSLRHPDE